METLYETDKRTQETANETVVTAKSNFLSLVEEIYKAPNKPQGYKGTVASMLWMYFSKTSKKKNTWRRAALKELLMHLFIKECYEILNTIAYVEVLYRISAFGNRYVNNITEWEPASQLPEEQLKSLIKHSFEYYQTPDFLISSFFEEQKKYMLWYVQLGAGKSVQKLIGLPFGFTKKMAHEFKKTPEGFSVAQALIRAQAIGYGASDSQTEQMIWSGLTRVEGHEQFWSTVVHFFARHEIAFNEIDEILAYLSFVIERNAAYTMQGRTLDALKRQTEEWRNHMNNLREEQNYMRWESSNIPAFSLGKIIDNKKVTYKIIELLDSRELYVEGYDMHHCVASYADDCFIGDSAIFSMRKYSDDKVEKLATIEIEPQTKELIEVQAKYNEMISSEAQEILELWIERVNITIEEVGAVPNEMERNPETLEGINNTIQDIIPVRDWVEEVRLKRETRSEINLEVEVSLPKIGIGIFFIVRLIWWYVNL
ncbi:PcfJ domain-containing protein [Aquimarina rhabdastrellae]